MKFRAFPAVLCLLLVPTGAALFGQEADKNEANETIVVQIGGNSYSAAQLDRFRNALPPQYRQNVAHMNNKAFVDTYANLLALAKASEQAGLLEQEPYKSQFAFNRLNFLAQIYLSQLSSTLSITDEDRKKYYEDHIRDYSESDIAVIHIEYDPLPELAEQAGRTPVSEQDARAEAEKLLSEIRAGADFAAVAKAHSDDKLSAEEGGALGWLGTDGQLPAALKKVVFGLEEGQLSPVVKDGGKFYIFKVHAIRSKPYSEAQPDILKKLQNSKLQARLEEIRATMPVAFIDADYALETPGAP